MSNKLQKHSIFTIAPHAHFLKVLALNILDGTLLSGWDMSGDFALSDVNIILPTRRAQFELCKQFSDLLGGGALLPNITTFGEQNEEEAIFLPPFDVEHLPKQVSKIKRSMILAKMIEAWAIKNGRLPTDIGEGKTLDTRLNHSEILALSTSLCQLIDSFLIEDIPIKNLKNIAPENLAHNWQQTLEFLDLALEAWPKILHEENKIDSVELRNIIIKRQADAAKQIFADKPVIAAGSTGSVLATSNLLKAISKLERGVVVLPGFNNKKGNIFHLLLNKEKNPSGHSQYAMAKTLAQLDFEPDEVKELAPKNIHNRTKIIRYSMALIDESANWAKQRKQEQLNIEQAIKNISIIEAPNDEMQARSIAMASIEALTRNHSIGIISPDQNLARRIKAELLRFGIILDDSAGTPLFQTPAGRFLRLIIATAKSGFAAVDLIALLKNQFSTFALGRADIAKIADLIEFGLLRSQKPSDGIAALKLALKENITGKQKYIPLYLNESEGVEVENLLNKIEEIFAPIISLFKQEKFYVAQFAKILNHTILGIIKTNDEKININPDMKQLLNWLDELIQINDSNSPSLSSFEIAKSLKELMGGNSFVAPNKANNKVYIWGQLEARLQNPDLIIIAGFNETIWPKTVDSGAWLSRNMAIAAGLSAPEKKIGQAAHDFEMAMGNENVIISYSKRIGTTPALPSRFLQRFFAFIGEEAENTCLKKGREWLSQAERLDFEINPKPATRPSPCPIAAIRPKSLSVTEIMTLIRSPYDIYAKYILGLNSIDALGAEVEAKDRGSLIHKIFENFIKDKINPKAPDAFEQLINISNEVFSSLTIRPNLQTLYQARFEIMAKRFIEFEIIRDAEISTRNAEISGKWELPAAENIFTLRGEADRIDIKNDDSLEIIDFKTGQLPSATEMREYLAPQLLLEAAMAQGGAFVDIKSAQVTSLKYIKISNSPDAFEVTDFANEGSLEQAIDEIIMRLSRHVQEMLFSDKTPMSARVFPAPKQTFVGAYEHLARTGEWSLAEGVEDEA